jgi:hypothetical protein
MRIEGLKKYRNRNPSGYFEDLPWEVQLWMPSRLQAQTNKSIVSRMASKKPYTLSHPDFPPVDWRAIGRKYDIYWADMSLVDPERPFHETKASDTATLVNIPCYRDLPECNWTYPKQTARQIAAKEYLILRVERNERMRKAGLNPPPVFGEKSLGRGFKRAGVLQMQRAILDNYYSWAAKQERALQFPEEVAAEKRRTKSKLLPWD